MKRFLVLLALFVAVPAYPWTLSWDPVTTYTDGSPVEPSKMPVRYEAKKDNVVLITNTTATSIAFTDTGHGLTRSFTMKAMLQTGEESVWSPPYSWTVPLGVLTTPGNPRIAPLGGQ